MVDDNKRIALSERKESLRYTGLEHSNKKASRRAPVIQATHEGNVASQICYADRAMLDYTLTQCGCKASGTSAASLVLSSWLTGYEATVKIEKVPLRVTAQHLHLLLSGPIQSSSTHPTHSKL